MQLSKTLVLVALAFGASASAASIGSPAAARDVALSSSDLSSGFAARMVAARATSASAASAGGAASAASAASKEFKQEQKDVQALLKQDKPDPAAVKAVFERISASAKKANDAMQAAKSKRQVATPPFLVPAIAQLTVDLNNLLLTGVEPLVRHLTANLDLGTVQNLVDALSPGLASLIIGVEALLNSLAPGLSGLVDPLLVVVYGLTAGLGLNLNLPAAPSPPDFS